MTAALGTLLTLWVILHMGVKRTTSSVFQGNIGSLRVFQNCAGEDLISLEKDS